MTSSTNHRPHSPWTMFPVLALACLQPFFAIAEPITKEIKIARGPYIIPVEQSLYSFLSPDIKVPGKAIVFETEATTFLALADASLSFSRFNAFEKDFVSEAECNYGWYSTNGDSRWMFRYCFAGEHSSALNWLYVRAHGVGDVTIVKNGNAIQEHALERLDDGKVQFVLDQLLATQGFSVEDGSITRNDKDISYRGKGHVEQQKGRTPAPFSLSYTSSTKTITLSIGLK